MTENLGKKLKETAQKNSSRIAIQYKKDNQWLDMSYGELMDRIGSMSAFLKEEGVKKDDRIAILLENRPEWPIIFFATVSIDAISVPINPSAPRKEIENILRDSGAKLVFVSKELKFEDVKIVPVSNVEKPTKTAEVAINGNLRGLEMVNERDVACILYTSGTTDEPKGVMLSHRNLLANCESLYKLKMLKESDSVLAMLPLHHTYPLTVTMILPLIYGGKVVYPVSIHSEDVAEAMQKCNPTAFVAVPQIFHMLYTKIKENFDKLPFIVRLLPLARVGLHKRFGKAMRIFISGGAKLNEDVAKGFLDLGFKILEGYGLTETSPVLTLTPQKKPKVGSVGLAVPDVEIKIIEKDKKGIGEVIARGPNIMKGYYKKDNLTNEVIKDGWFHTGDLGYIDEDGYLFLTGRSKEVIVLSSGKNVYPQEIEEAYLKEIPAKEMCVFEVPSKKGMQENEILWAIVVPDLEFFKKFGEVNLRNVIKERFDNVSRTLPAYKRVMGFSVTLDELPHTLLGKIKRFKVKEIYASKIAKEKELVSAPQEVLPEDRELMQSFHGKKIIEYLKQQTKVKGEIVPANSLELDLGIDSLGRIELVSDLEKIFNTEIKDEIVGQSFTVKDLIIGVKSVVPETATHAEAKEANVKTKDWKRILEVLPEEENLKKIELNPGFGAWLAGFIFMMIFCILPFKLLYKLKVKGRENFPKAGPYILYVNHTSYLDGFVTAATFPKFPRLELFFVGFRPYFEAPIIRNLVKIGRMIPLDFVSHLLEALRSCYYVLKNKKGICLYPEGLRTGDGNINEFKVGFGILAKESGAKVVPVFLKGTFEAWSRTEKLPKLFMPLEVIYGKPQDPEELEKEGFKMGAKDSYTAICLAARKILADLKEAA